LLGVVALLFFWVRRRRPNSDPESPSRITTFSGAPPSGSSPILPPTPGKASDARQRYLQQELRAVQEKIVDVDDMERQMLTDQGSRNRNGSILRRNLDTATSQLNAARAHNDQLIARIQELEVQMQSSWALGLSDEAPPGYTA
jgi:septal ring factor EnvC (AmiA/AmiB activator)